MNGNTSSIQLYLSAPHPCNYLAAPMAAELWVDPDYPMTTALYGMLAAQGFRRSGDHLYRPHCPDCRACIPVRIDCTRFKPSRSQRRCRQLNGDLQLSISDTPEDDFLPLYRKYISARHAGGAMDTPAQQNPLDFLDSDWCTTHFYAFRRQGQLLAVSTVDVFAEGLSAVYTFFDPEQSHRGLGNLAVLTLIEQAQHANLPWVYLGYWIAECQKMSYKNRFQPLEYYLNDYWHRDSLTNVDDY